LPLPSVFVNIVYYYRSIIVIVIWLLLSVTRNDIFRASQQKLVAAAEYDWSSVEHTSVDGFDFMSHFIDVNFAAHSTMTQLLTDITFQLLSAARLPVDIRQLSTSLQRMLSTLPLDGVPLNDDVTRLLGQSYRADNNMHCESEKLGPNRL